MDRAYLLSSRDTGFPVTCSSLTTPGWELTDNQTLQALAKYFRVVRYSDTTRWPAKQIRTRSLTL
jgi:hypothetical protein